MPKQLLADFVITAVRFSRSNPSHLHMLEVSPESAITGDGKQPERLEAVIALLERGTTYRTAPPSPTSRLHYGDGERVELTDDRQYICSVDEEGYPTSSLEKLPKF